MREYLDILADLVKINSISGNEKEIGEYIYNFLVSCGYTVEKQHISEDRFNIFAKRGKPKICFFGHMDTVPPNGVWSKSPFKLTVEENKAYGLGSWDMKSGLAVILALAQEKDIALLFTVDEEEISEGGWKATENKNFFNDIELILSAEAGNTPTTPGGLPYVAIGRYGRVVVKAEKHFSAGHSATTKDEWLDWLTENKDTFRDDKLRIKIEDIELVKKGFSNPEKIILTATVLIHPDVEDWKEKLNDLFDSWNLIERKTPYLLPYKTKRTDLVECVLRDANAVEVIGNSPGDENAFFTLGIPILIIGTRGENEHSADEFVYLDSVERLYNFYKGVLDHEV